MHTKQHHSSWLHISYKKKEGRVRGREGGWVQEKKEEGEKGGGRKGRGRKTREEREIFVECQVNVGSARGRENLLSPACGFLRQ